MYQVPHFSETDVAVLHAFVAAHPLGLLVSGGATGLLANAIPFLLYAGEGPSGTLRAHLSRGNPQWQALAETPDALVVFRGAQHYVTPSWYPQKAIDHKVVPTWNYAVVQARGRARLIEDSAWLHAHVGALADRHEAGRVEPWSVVDAPPAFIAGQLKGIVGVEIEIAALEGKFKASQNRPEADRRGVIAGLAGEPDPDAAAMAELVRQRNGL